MRPLLAAILLALLAAAPARGQPMPIFDAHLHYNEEAFAPYPLEAVLELFRRNDVRGILATSRPNEGTRRLVEAKAEGLWVAPFIRPYAVRADRGTWFREERSIELIERELARGGYRGIGEFHIDRGADAEHEVVKRIVALSVRHGLWLHAHVDAATVETLFGHDPRARVIWAHTGFFTPPAEVERLLAKYENLLGELSYRSGLTEAGGALAADWRRLFTARPDRFLLGSDTWINERWASYGETIAGYRAWLAQLPKEAAEQIAWKNGERLFGPR